MVKNAEFSVIEWAKITIKILATVGCMLRYTTLIFRFAQAILRPPFLGTGLFLSSGAVNEEAILQYFEKHSLISTGVSP